MAITPEKGTYRVDAALSNIAVDYYNNLMTLAKGMALPYLMVNKDSGKYYKFNKDSFRLAQSNWRPGTTANEIVPYVASTSTYTCNKKKLKALVTDDEIKQADKPIQPMARTTKKIKDNIDTELEYLLAAALQDTSSNFSNANGTVSYAWSSDTATIFTDVKDAKSSIRKNAMVEANFMVINPDDFDNVIDNADIKDRVKFTDGNPITEQRLASLFGLQKVIVPKAVYNTTDRGQTDSMSYCFGSGKVFIGYAPSSTSLWEPSVGYIIAEKLYGGKNVRVRKYRPEEDREATYVEVSRSYDIVITAEYAGYVLDITP
ncbi:MAG: hypothetical protein ACTSRU_20110 [Candidatus Hodarchaeales archaeon]